MPTADLKLICLIFFLSLITAGCASNQIHLKPFHGLNHNYQTPGQTLNVVFVHGMGDHRFGEPDVLKYQKRIAHELGFEEADVHQVDWEQKCKWPHTDNDSYNDYTSEEKRCIAERKQANQSVCELRIENVVIGFIGWRQYRSQDNGKILNLFELSWDRATELLQKRILELDNNYCETIELDDNGDPIENGLNREADRAFANRWLKRFVNQNLGDPVIYLGNYGNSIRQTIAEGLATISQAAGGDEQGEYNYSIISDSLGSRIVFDTLGCVIEPGNNNICSHLRDEANITSDEVKSLENMANNMTQVFMNANQLPFLALSQVGPPKPGQNENEWLNRFPCASEAAGMMNFLMNRSGAQHPLQIVAFTDPNDALSYHLTDRFQKKCAYIDNNHASPINYINVRIPNVKWTFFGLFANPVKAHSSGFRCNPEAIRLLVEGNREESE